MMHPIRWLIRLWILSGCFVFIFNCRTSVHIIPHSVTAEALLRYEPGKLPRVSAHRGGAEKNYPENCIETFEKTLHQACAMLECDIRITKDRQLILMHDHTLDRTTNGDGLVRNRTLEEIRSLRLKDPEGRLTSYRVPLLEEVLQWAKDKTIMFLDIKPEVPFDSVIAVVQRCEASRRVVIITYSADDAQRIHQLDSTVMISVSLKQTEDLSRLEAYGVPANRMVAFTGVAEPDQKLIDTLHRRGMAVICGTIGNLDRKAEARGDTVYQALMEKGVDVLATDRPQAADAVIRRLAKARNLRRECAEKP